MLGRVPGVLRQQEPEEHREIGLVNEHVHWAVTAAGIIMPIRADAGGIGLSLKLDAGVGPGEVQIVAAGGEPLQIRGRGRYHPDAAVHGQLVGPGQSGRQRAGDGEGVAAEQRLVEDDESVAGGSIPPTLHQTVPRAAP